jgi:hypothetical protein
MRRPLAIQQSEAQLEQKKKNTRRMRVLFQVKMSAVFLERRFRIICSHDPKTSVATEKISKKSE